MSGVMQTHRTFEHAGRVGCIFVSAMLLGAISLAIVQWRREQVRREAALDRSLNEEGAVAPRWIRLVRRCLPVTAREAMQDAAMADLAATFAERHDTPGLDYVIQYFGWHWALGPSATTARCPPAPELYGRIAPIPERADWLRYARDRNDLMLIEHLPPSPYLARRLDELAFGSDALPHSALGYDNRPYTRMLLAYQGSYARPWAAAALAAIAPDTKLGTSAAFLAVSVAPDEALPRVAAAMHRFQAEADARRVAVPNVGPADRGFATRDGDRLYELAYAMVAAGPRAEPYSDTLVKLLDQKFGVSSHFGLLLLEPKGLCPVARRIGGRAAAAANAKRYCREFERAAGR